MSWVCCEFISGLFDISMNHYLLIQTIDEQRVRCSNCTTTATSDLLLLSWKMDEINFISSSASEVGL